MASAAASAVVAADGAGVIGFGTEVIGEEDTGAAGAA